MTPARGLAAIATLALAIPLVSQNVIAQTPAVSPWGARAPLTCAPLKTAAAPTIAQATQLIRCARESASNASGELYLAEKVVVNLGPAKPFRDMYNVYTMADADTTKSVYPITGSYTQVRCILNADAAIYGNAGKNCGETDITNAKGACWVTRSSGWKCNFTGTSTTPRLNVPPPK